MAVRPATPEELQQLQGARPATPEELQALQGVSSEFIPEGPLAPQVEPQGAFAAAGEAFREVAGERFGFDDPLEAQRFSEFAGPFQPIVRPALDLGVAALEALGGLGVAEASLAGDVAARLTGTDPRAARREFKAILETPITGGISRVSRRPARRADDVVEAGIQEGVPVLTTDVIPPTTRGGRFAQQTAETLPIVGTGGARSQQQVKRIEAVENLANDFDITIDATFEKQIIQSLDAKKLENLSKAVSVRNEALNALGILGDVPTINANRAITNQIAKQQALKGRANQGLIKLLDDTRSSLSGNFVNIKNIRTQVIKDIKELQRGEHVVLSSQDEAALQAVKSAIDNDLLAFARKNDRQAAAKWLQSNKLFADEFTKFKGTELKRLLDKGQVTPEIVGTTLRGGKPSELNRLVNNLTTEGKANARAAILKGIFEKAGLGTEAGLNPNRFITELERPNTQRAINIFFKGTDKTRIEGLKKLLAATRRAQEASVTTPTGQQMVLLTGGAGVGFGAAVAPLETFFAVGGIGAASRAYESPAVRDFLLRAARAKEGPVIDRMARQFDTLIKQIQASTVGVIADGNQEQ